MEPEAFEQLWSLSIGRDAEAPQLPKDVRWDHARLKRRGFGETILGVGKTVEQVLEAIEAAGSTRPVLVTRANPDWLPKIQARVADVQYHDLARALVIGTAPPLRDGPPVAVVTAGTADRKVAEEALLTLELSGLPTRPIFDVGVAGLHRLLSVLDDIQAARVVIAVAGMEGTLPGVLAGLLSIPVIGVPTSVGVGAHGGGLVPLFTMLNACAEGLAVVNVDNGFGAARLAQLIWETGSKNSEEAP